MSKDIKQGIEFGTDIDAETIGDSSDVDIVTEESLVVVFSKPYTFEGKIYNDINLSELEDIKGNDLVAVSKIYNKSGNYAPVPELDLEYALNIAARATKKPIEFFKNLPARECLRIKNRVIGFFYNGD